MSWQDISSSFNEYSSCRLILNWFSYLHNGTCCCISQLSNIFHTYVQELDACPQLVPFAKRCCSPHKEYSLCEFHHFNWSDLFIYHIRSDCKSTYRVSMLVDRRSLVHMNWSCVFDLEKKKKRSDSVLWQKSLHPQKTPKSNVTTHKRHQKLRLHNNCGLT